MGIVLPFAFFRPTNRKNTIFRCKSPDCLCDWRIMYVLFLFVQPVKWDVMNILQVRMKMSWDTFSVIRFFFLFFFMFLILLSVSQALDGCRGHKRQLVCDDHLNASEQRNGNQVICNRSGWRDRAFLVRLCVWFCFSSHVFGVSVILRGQSHIIMDAPQAGPPGLFLIRYEL